MRENVLSLFQPNFAVVSFAFLFFKAEAVCGFFKEISTTSACDMVLKMVIVMLLAVDTTPLAGVPFGDRP
jgi:hypothetical protein